MSKEYLTLLKRLEVVYILEHQATDVDLHSSNSNVGNISLRRHHPSTEDRNGEVLKRTIGSKTRSRGVGESVV